MELASDFNGIDTQMLLSSEQSFKEGGKLCISRKVY